MKKIILNRVHKNSPNYKKYFALIDNEDYERVSGYNWFVKKYPHTMYAVAWINGKPIYLHIFIMGFKGVDHVSGNGLDCQKSNMRKATNQQNHMNMKPQKNTSSQYKGVTWFKRDSKWKASIMYNYKHIHLGLFVNEIEAAKAYNDKAVELFGEFAKLNIL